MIRIFAFLLAMWLFILLGGGIAIIALESFSASEYGQLGSIPTTITKAAIVISLVVIWVLILAKVKNWIFHREIKS